jgi:phage portal protein BeeE
MAFWTKKKEIPTQKASVMPNLPIIEAFGKISPSFQNISTRKAYAESFSNVSEVYSVIMYRARAFSNLKLKLFKTDVKGSAIDEITSHDVLTRLESPNPLYNWTNMLQLRSISKDVFGNSYILKHIPSGYDKKIKDWMFWVLPGQYTYAVPKANRVINIYQGNEINDFIKGYTLYFDRVDYSKAVMWEPELIMHEKAPNLKIDLTTFYSDILEGRSPLATLSEPITNIRKAYEAQNVILEKRGALGILSPKNSKDQVGAVMLTNDQKIELQKQFSMYGLGTDDWQYIITNVEVLWQQMSVPIKELMLFEGIENSMTAICNTYNFPKLLLNYLQGSTFSNLNELKKSLYQDNIIPEGKAFVQQLNSFLGLREQNLLLEADFSHVPILQDDSKVEAEKDEIVVGIIRGLQEDISRGIMTVDQGRLILSSQLSLSNEITQDILTDTKITDNTISRLDE